MALNFVDIFMLIHMFMASNEFIIFRLKKSMRAKTIQKGNEESVKEHEVYIAIQMKNPCRASLDWSIKREKQNLMLLNYPPKCQRVKKIDKSNPCEEISTSKGFPNVFSHKF
jgi:hypothetical protein